MILMMLCVVGVGGNGSDVAPVVYVNGDDVV